MNKSILHITDLHLNDFEGVNEHLRKRFYKEYLDGLTKCISLSEQSVDYVVISGDFVDKGKVENFPHIQEIIKYLCDKLNIDEQHVCVCIGNHDFEYKKEYLNGNNSIKLREPFNEFSSKYNDEIKESYDRATLKKVDTNIWFLSIDSTLGSNSKKLKGKPGNISHEDVDIIVNDFVKKHINNGDILLIGCHYPIEQFPNSLGGNSEENWSEKHFWRQGGSLRTRINKIENVVKVWFMGDTHFPDHLQYENAYFLMTGRFGGTTLLSNVKYVSHIDRQCKIISFEDSTYQSLHTYNFRMSTHEDSQHYGEWEHVNSSMRKFESTPAKGSKKTIQTSVTDEQTSRIGKISLTIENQIIQRITELDLYSFGRFKTDNYHTSLGWVSINQLLNDHKILSSIVSKSVVKVQEKVISKINETAIVGLDFWGAIIGSQVSVRTGLKHFCIAARGNGQYHSDLEFNNNSLESQIPKLKCIIIYIDVISSGNTIIKIIDSIKNINSDIKFHLISVISNNRTINNQVLNQLESFGSFCLDLKIPVIKNSELPDENILPPNIDFSIKSE